MVKNWDVGSLATTLVILIALLFLHAAYWLWVGLDHPALDFYNFRQTQTAWSAYWLWRDGFRLAYETPVLGYPWAIPYEFPLYQWLVALLRHLSVPIDVGGRLVSFGFYIATLYPLWILGRARNLPRLVWLVVAILFLASPFYVYWSRTVMIESCALFFSVSMLALIARYLNGGRSLILMLAFAAGALAVLVKSTTFPAFAFLAGLLVLGKGYAAWRHDELSRATLRPLLLALGALFGALLIGVLWVWYTDGIKAANPFGAHLMSTNLTHFNFGTWGQRVSSDLWRTAIFDRALPEIFGYGVLVAGIAAAAALQSRRYALLMLGALAGFVLPFLLFTNLHVVHSYYQNANALLGLIAVGLGIVVIAELGQKLLAAIILVTIVVGQLVFFQTKYAPVIRQDLTKNPIYLISQAAKAKIPEGQALLVLGQDWSSAIPYYSERKALSLPGWASPLLTQKALETPEQFLGGLKLGGIIYCAPPPGPRRVFFEQATAARISLAEASHCKLLSPTP